ncbi:DUF4142 domain-containing protein [Sphingomonas zeae]|jgi:hypothetical protein|uniref:DUF4142 domain-containing protein n=1 Tax=Sphingomonas zeae TaxID=1646122 RepID=A0A7Y6B5K7_9SPHN|nr:DUF4142 domain-containing protein [Sphingomonas zeae]MBB4048726.1 putative membrane protein [Sphingomonas zeae]NUU47845.1 DUF4142 domain-containing protein [Sphingomonas zeae]
MRHLLIAAMVSTIAIPAVAQSGYSVSNAPDGAVTTAVFGVVPVSRVAAADYVTMSADALNYRIAAERLSSQRQASIDLLRKAPRASFDTLYLQQVSDTAPAMWAQNKGYAQDGTDPTLRQVATAYVPVIEHRYQGARDSCQLPSRAPVRFSRTGALPSRRFAAT